MGRYRIFKGSNKEVCVLSFQLALQYMMITHFPCPVFVVNAGQADGVFTNMAGDFMKPVVDVVDQLLTAGVNVTVYNGQLDLIVDTLGNSLKPQQ